MKYAKGTVLEVIDHIRAAAKAIDVAQAERLIECMIGADRIFIYGVGRSGLVGKAFGMRLTHLNIPVYIVGDVTTPAMEKGDVLFVLSGSGNTKSVVLAADVAKQTGAKVIALTSNEESSVAKLADICVIVKGRTKEDVENLRKEYLINQITGSHIPLSPMGTLFEITCQVFLDAAIVEMMHRLGKTEHDMKKRHANVE